ncbi:hypothetical protein ADL06_08070 [Streptomyces sp. NRRL F-6491]|nr:hypothetical protein ADL06_08070 [Streptomyces sp. NRRL F-6491]KOX42352.1 hypothetical protein ADL08_16830 [Streptomyces sp. NRRL F-6492]
MRVDAGASVPVEAGSAEEGGMTCVNPYFVPVIPGCPKVSGYEMVALRDREAPMSFDVFVHKFENGELVPLDTQAAREVLAP